MAMIRQPENLPEMIKTGRLQLKRFQEERVHALGVSFANVSRWKNGKTLSSKMAPRQFEQFCMEQDSKGRRDRNRVDEIKN